MHPKIPSSSRRRLELFKAGVFLIAALAAHGRALAGGAPAATHFSYSAPKASSVGLAGEFNNFQPAPMTKGADGTWAIDVPLAPGDYGYKFVVDGNDWELDPNNPAKKNIGGIDNSSITVGGAPAATGSAAPAGGVLFTYSNPTATSVTLAGQFNNWDTSATAMQKDSSGVWSVRLPLQPGSYQYKLYVDGAWLLDPGNPQQAGDGTGNKNSVMVVGGAAPSAGSAASAPAAPSGTDAMAGSTPTPAPEDPMSLGGTQIQPGKQIEFDIPLPADTWRQTFLDWPIAQGEPRMSDDMRLKPAGVHVGFVAPQGFDPARRWPLLIICGGGGSSSVDQMGDYFDISSDAGWVTLATDVRVDHSSDSNLIRWAGLTTAFDFLHNKWPASKHWPIAIAGFDGGARKCGYLAPMLVRQGYDLIGIWLGGVDYETPSLGMHAYNPPHVKFLQTPVFLSSGKDDKNTDPVKMRIVYRSLESAGFEDPKFGVFTGGHEVAPDQLKQGLDWFIEKANAHPTLDN